MAIFKFVFLACPNIAHVVRCNLTKTCCDTYADHEIYMLGQQKSDCE